MIVTRIRRNLGAGQCGSSDERVLVRCWRRKKNACVLRIGGMSTAGEEGGKKRTEATLGWMLFEVRESWHPCRRPGCCRR